MNRNNEWFIIDYGNDFDGDIRTIFRTYQYARSQAGKYPVNRLVLDKDWTEPEEWVVPTDEDAKRRPMVEVRYYGGGDWHAARLLAVVKNGDNDCFVVDECFDKKPRIENYAICRMKASERNQHDG